MSIILCLSKEKTLIKKIFYLIGVEKGVKPFGYGPYKTEIERDNTAKVIRERQGDDDSLFWADFNHKRGLIIGSYTAGFFFPNENDGN